MEDRKGRNFGERGVGFKDEFHSRIKFNRRGLLAMANEGTENTNGSQFFITLGDTPELQGKNTLFGRVEGETIYNVARMGEVEVGANERPMYPTKITGVEILVNPFKDMVRRERIAPVAISQKVSEKKKKRKTGKQLLSFGDDGDGEVEAPMAKKTKFDTRIVTDVDDLELESKAKPARETKKKTTKPVSIESSPEPAPAAFKTLPTRATKGTRDISSSPEPEAVQKVSSALERTNAQIAELKASMKRNTQIAPVKEKKKSALEEMIPINAVRGRKRHPGGNASSRDDKRALDILNAFRAKLEQAPPEKEIKAAEIDESPEKHGEVGDDEEAALCDLHFIANCQSCKKWDAQDGDESEAEDDGIGWMSHALSFKEDKLGKDLTYRKKAEEEMVVIDPREKARTLKEEKKAQREAKAGGSGRAWDQARNEKMARSSALAGRGAK